MNEKKNEIFVFLFFSFSLMNINRQRQTITQRAQYRTPSKENNPYRQLQVYIFTKKKTNICNCQKRRKKERSVF
jgi:hypothetical protein